VFNYLKKRSGRPPKGYQEYLIMRHMHWDLAALRATPDEVIQAIWRYMATEAKAQED
jgi:hypothetical protein